MLSPVVDSKLELLCWNASLPKHFLILQILHLFFWGVDHVCVGWSKDPPTFDQQFFFPVGWIPSVGPSSSPVFDNGQPLGPHETQVKCYLCCFIYFISQPESSTTITLQWHSITTEESESPLCTKHFAAVLACTARARGSQEAEAFCWPDGGVCDGKSSFWIEKYQQNITMFKSYIEGWRVVNLISPSGLFIALLGWWVGPLGQWELSHEHPWTSWVMSKDDHGAGIVLNGNQPFFLGDLAISKTDLRDELGQTIKTHIVIFYDVFDSVGDLTTNRLVAGTLDIHILEYPEPWQVAQLTGWSEETETSKFGLHSWNLPPILALFQDFLWHCFWLCHNDGPATPWLI